MIDELTSYLDQQADRVAVHDTLADIESGVGTVQVRPLHRGRRWVAPAIVGAAAALVVLIGVATTVDAPTADVGSGQEPVPVDGDTAFTDPALADTAVPTTAAAPALVPIPLPDGGTMQGFSPMCTTRDGIEFDCLVEGYRNAGGYDDGGINHTGEVQVVINGTSIVSGGCRSTSADGSTWHCALGERSVELEMVSASYLGEWAPIGYAAG
jgi:hypothetical protein